VGERQKVLKAVLLFPRRIALPLGTRSTTIPAMLVRVLRFVGMTFGWAAVLFLLSAPALGEDAHDHFVCGQMAWNLGFSKEAITEFTRALEMNSNYAEAYLYRGMAKATASDLTNALADFNKAIEISPVMAEAYSGRAYARQARGDLAGALADYSRAIDLKSDSAEPYGGRARARQAKGDLDGALGDYDRAIELQPYFAEVYVGRGSVKRTKGDLDGALADYTKAVELKPDLAEAYKIRGNIKLEKGDMAEATGDLPQASLSLRIAKGEMGDFTNALADFSQAIKLNPADAEAYHTRGFLYYELRSFTNALADFHKACEMDPEDQTHSHFGLWLVRARLGEQKAANEELQTCLAKRKAGTSEDWPSKVARFLASQLSEPDFLKAADNSYEKRDACQHCEAYFYAGSKRLMEGDVTIAADYFKNCLGTQAKTIFEYHGAAAELRRLKAAK
jgi:tetratricopeptide (TPR) repeat protein